MLKRSRRNFPNVHLIWADILYLPFSVSTFNLLLCVGVSEYIEDKEKLLKNVYISLKPGGMAIITISTCHFLNYLRNIIGHRIFILSALEFELYLERYNLKIMEKVQTTLQIQYLVQKQLI